MAHKRDKRVPRNLSVWAVGQLWANQGGISARRHHEQLARHPKGKVLPWNRHLFDIKMN